MPSGDKQREKIHCPQGHPYDEENTKTGSGRQGRQCKKCSSSRVSKYYSEHPERKQEARLKTLYGITKLEYDEMLTAQENCCVICGSDERLCVDHDHKTGKVRGILCVNCNSGLGSFFDSIDLMERAIHYLRVDA